MESNLREREVRGAVKGGGRGKIWDESRMGPSLYLGRASDTQDVLSSERSEMRKCVLGVVI